VNRLADYEENINATVIALDAQKAFDSVSHKYIEQVLQKAGLTNMVQIFRLLYKDLCNDIIINGSIGKGYKIKNGVKQGDALSCSLFILAVEPLIRNIMNNPRIPAISSTRLQYTWPKLVAYADDITVLTKNDNGAVNTIFEEYNRLTHASGLTLNADKTEKFDIYSRNVVRPVRRIDVRYGTQSCILTSQDTIKLNGIIFKKNILEMRQANFEIMINKMKMHFKEWGRRSLSLLGKIQIIKTFGISQYLYTLAVVDIGDEHWKVINKELHKFIWNKHYNIDGNAAPHRIKKAITYTEVKNGGFGMVRLDRVMAASRLRRYSYLLATGGHPVAHLQRALGADKHLRSKAKLDIDDVTSGTLKLIHHHLIQAYGDMENDDIGRDLLMHRLLLGCEIKDVVPIGRQNSIELTLLRQRGITTIKEAVSHGRESMLLLGRVTSGQLQRQLTHIRRCYSGRNVPEIETGVRIYNTTAKQWLAAAQLSSRQLRLILWQEDCITTTKILNQTEDSARLLYSKLLKLRNVPNKTKMLRLIHGDVYCGTRLYAFGLAESDRCIRCFEAETIRHLLYECPYSIEVWGRLGLLPHSAAEIVNGQLSRIEFEIRAELISHLVFRKKVLPPEILIRTVINSFGKGLSQGKGVKDYARMLITRQEFTGQWFT
jgi:hypothetical protein